MNQEHDPAKSRLMMLHAVRWTGVALVVFAALVIAGRIDFPKEAGYALFVVGLIDAFFVPAFLAKRWKSPPR